MVVRPNPSFLDECEALGLIYGERRWRNGDGTRLYTWDSLHGELKYLTGEGVIWALPTR
jgi:hypothetical protein